MKKLIFIIALLLGSLTFFSCEDEWGNGAPEMEHVYYTGFQEWGKFNNKFEYNVEQGETIEIPIEFHSERTRKYNVTTYFYVGDELVKGTDFEIVDEKDSVINPDENGAYAITWKKAEKGIHNVKVKALKGAKGAFTLHTFDPKAGKIKHPDNITNSQTNDYEVRAFSQNYKVTIKIK